MVQTYLISGRNEACRVRKCSKAGITTYYYTRKVDITAVTRQEEEREISVSEYEQLLLQKDTSRNTIDKCRYYIANKGLTYELDCFNGITEVAYLEVELTAEDQLIAVPNGIKVIKEVTNDSAYTNKALSKKYPKDFK